MLFYRQPVLDKDWKFSWQWRMKSKFLDKVRLFWLLLNFDESVRSPLIDVARHPFKRFSEFRGL